MATSDFYLPLSTPATMSTQSSGVNLLPISGNYVPPKTPSPAPYVGLTTSTGAPMPVSPPLTSKVVTVGSSDAAEKRLNNITSDLANIDQGIANQNAQKSSMNLTPSEEENRKAIMGLTDSLNNATSAVTGTGGTGTGTTGTSGTGATGATDPLQAQLDTGRANLDKAFETFQQQAQSYANGTLPLTAEQQAQVAELQRQFENAKKEQLKVNANFEGGTNIAAIVSGRNRYAPEIAMGDLKAAQDAGAAKIADIDAKSVAAVAQLKEGFRTSNYQQIESAYKIYQDYQSKKSAELQDQIDRVNQFTKDTQAKQQEDSSNLLALAQNQLSSPDISADQKNALLDSLIAGGQLTGSDKQNLQSYWNNITKDYTKEINDFLSAQGQVVNPITGQIEQIRPKVTAKTTPIAPTPTGDLTDAQLIAQAIINGNQPPALTGLYSKGAAVKAELERQGYDLTAATQDWTAMQKRIATMNSTSQVRLQQAVNFSYDSLDIIEQLSDEWNAGGFPALNKVKLLAAKNGALGEEAMSLATRLDAQINDLTSELGTVYKGGNSSTDESLKLAAANLNANWSQKTLQDAIDLARTNLQIRKNSIANSGMIEGNQYSPETQGQTVESQIANDIRLAIPDTTNWPNREVLIEAISEHYGIPIGEAGAYVYGQWTDNQTR